MRTLIVVNNPRDWQFDIPGVEVVDAWKYLDDPGYGALQRARVFNLCRSYQYQSHGYYVSLVAAARDHKPLPTVMTIQDMKTRSVIRVMSDELDELIQKHLFHLTSHRFELSIYFGRNIAKRYEHLSIALYRLFETPLLRAYFHRTNGKWFLQNIEPISTNEIPDEHKDFIRQAALEYFAGRRKNTKKLKEYRYDLAILTNEHEDCPPSDQRAIARFVRAADSLGIDAETISKDDFSRIVEFDALFIRETTNVNHHTYRFARKAQTEGLVVIDDPSSILRCSNKVYLSELLKTHGIPIPGSVNIHLQNVNSVKRSLAYPAILKQPDSAFSKGVVKVENVHEFEAAVEELFEKSAILVAQEFMPTDFDWRVGVLDNQVLYVCKYFMAPHHWQIVKKVEKSGRNIEGSFETIPVGKAPKRLITLALKASGLIGRGLYGVDIKQVGKRYVVIEINDNPSIESGIEDKVLKDGLYVKIMQVFLDRIEKKKAPRKL